MHIIDEIFNEFELNRTKIEWELTQMKESIAPYKNKIVLYGAGSAGIAFYEYLKEKDIKVTYFADGNQNKWGSFLKGVEIIPLTEIVKLLGTDALVIVTINTDGKNYCKSFDEALRSSGHQGVHKSLKDTGLKNVMDYTFFRRCFSLFYDDKYNLPSCSDVNIMVANKDKIKKVYELLEDEISKDIFAKIVKFRLLDDSLEIPTLPQNEKNFYNVNFNQDTIYFDCGAFDGITMVDVFNKAGCDLKGYYAIEPDNVNYNLLLENIKNNFKDKNIYTYELAMTKTKGLTKIESLKGPGSYLCDVGNETVNTDTIDNILNGDTVTHIKMNIEGSEAIALEGAKNTIEKYSPHLAIAGYHKTWDLWEIPLQILSYNPSYKIALKSYMNHISFMFYAF